MIAYYDGHSREPEPHHYVLNGEHICHTCFLASEATLDECSVEIGAVGYCDCNFCGDTDA